MICLPSRLFSLRFTLLKGWLAIAFVLIGLLGEATCQQSFPANPATIQGPSESSLATATESVNNSNGNVSVSIPLLHLPGVSGLDLNLNLTYDSKHYDAVGIGTPGVSVSMEWGGTNTFDPDFGKFGTLSIPRLNSDNIDVDSIDVGLEEPAIISCDTNFQFRDADGSVHAFDNTINCSQSNSGSYPLRNRPILDALDGSMIRLDLSDQTNAKVILKNGTVILFNLTDDPNDNGINNRYRRYAKSITDRYGNQIQLSGHPSTTMTITDTVGRAVTISNSSHRITYKNSSGNDVYIDLSTATSQGDTVTLHADSCVYYGTVQPGMDHSNYISTHDVVTSAKYEDTIALDSQGAARTFKVTLDGIGEVVRVDYPTGGYTRYGFQTYTGTYQVGLYNCWTYPIREVMSKNVCDSSSGSCSSEKTTTYNAVISASSNSQMTVTEPADDIGHQRKTVHDFAGTFSAAGNTMRTSREVKESIYDNSSTLLKTTDTAWTVLPGTTVDADKIIWSSRPQDVTEAFYGASGNTVKAIRTHNEYSLVSLQTAAASPHDTLQVYSDQPDSITVFDNSGNNLLTTALSWKNTGSYTPAGNHILDLLNSKTVTGSDGVYAADSFIYDTVGRISSSTRSGSDVSGITTSYEVDTQNRTTKITDPLSNVTKPSYGSSTDSPWYDTKCGVGTTSPQPHVIENAKAQKVTATYYSCTGLLASVKDVNGNTTTYTYDSLGRLLDSNYPDGGLTSRTYSSANQVKTTVRLSSTTSTVTQVNTDGLGQVIETQVLNDPACAGKAGSGDASHVVTTYDALGRRNSISHPYCTTSDATYGVRTTAYDALDRPTIMTNPDGSTQQSCYNNLKTDNNQTGCLSRQTVSANSTWIDVKDESGNKSQRINDSLGHLIHVYEDPGSNGLGLHTEYGYDGGGNLISVSQTGLSARTFKYDSLSRLRWSHNPETGVICYGHGDGTEAGCQADGYDDNGNLKYKTDARSVTISYGYDTLNRLVSKTYSSFAANTPWTCYQYDTSSIGYPNANLVGRLTHEWTQPGSCDGSNPLTTAKTRRSIRSYDSMGRVRMEERCVWTNCSTSSTPFALHFDYDVAGNLTEYDNGIRNLTLTNIYDVAGRLNKVTSTAYDLTHPNTLYNVSGFLPNGVPNVFDLGLHLNTTQNVDNRLRPSALTVVVK